MVLVSPNKGSMVMQGKPDWQLLCRTKYLSCVCVAYISQRCLLLLPEGYKWSFLQTSLVCRCFFLIPPHFTFDTVIPLSSKFHQIILYIRSSHISVTLHPLSLHTHTTLLIIPTSPHHSTSLTHLLHHNPPLSPLGSPRHSHDMTFGHINCLYKERRWFCKRIIF